MTYSGTKPTLHTPASPSATRILVGAFTLALAGGMLWPASGQAQQSGYMYRPESAGGPMAFPSATTTPSTGQSTGVRPSFLAPSQPAPLAPYYATPVPPGLGAYQQQAPQQQFQQPALAQQQQQFQQAPQQQQGYPPQYTAPAGMQQQQPATIITQVEVPLPQPVIDAAGTPMPLPPNVPAIIFESDQAGVPDVPLPVIEEAPLPPFDPGLLLQQKRYAELDPFIQQTRDSALAGGVGWSLYNDGRYEGAARYFERALEYNDANLEASYGLALSLFRMGRYNQAEAVARWRLLDYPQMQNLMGDILTGRAVASYQAKEYLKSRAYLEEVSGYRPLTRDEQLMQGWNYFHTGDEARAAAEFVRLYGEKQDKFAASGVYATYSRQQDWTSIERISKEYGGPIADLYKSFQGERFYNNKLYANAYATDPGRYPELRNIDSPYVDTRFRYRFKTGDLGLSRLQEVRGEMTAALYEDGINKFGVKMGVSYLDAGTLAPFNLVGLVPIPPQFGVTVAGAFPYIFAPTTTATVFDMRLYYEREGFYTPFIELGISPVGGEVAPTIVGKAGVRSVTDWGTWSLDIFRESVKESILSYVGIRDPFFGLNWGRVSESGLRGSVFKTFSQDFSFYGAAQASFLDGENVEENDHIRLTMAFNKEFKLEGFEYLVVGPAFSFDHYGKNLGFFTYGQGGYFSPDYLVQGMLQAQAMTNEGEAYLARGNIGIGMQSYRQAASPFFPLAPTGASFAQDDATTFIFLANIEGMMQMNEQWAIGGSLGYNQTADYSEFTAGVYLKYFFAARSGLFAFDFFNF